MDRDEIIIKRLMEGYPNLKWATDIKVSFTVRLFLRHIMQRYPTIRVAIEEVVGQE